MNYRLLLAGMFFSPCLVFSQGFHSGHETSAIIPGYTSRQATIFTIDGNTASLAGLNKPEAGISAGRKFMMQGFTNLHLTAAMIRPFGNFSAGLHTAGFTAYRETELSFAFAKRLGDKLDAGVRFNYNEIRVQGYGKSSGVSGDASFIIHLSEKMHAGIQMKNLVQAGSPGPVAHQLPVICSMGILYEASPVSCLGIVISKEQFQPLQVNAAFKYIFHPRVWAVAGISTASSSFRLGAAWVLPSFRIEIVNNFHQHLGVSPQVFVVIPFKSRGE